MSFTLRTSSPCSAFKQNQSFCPFWGKWRQIKVISLLDQWTAQPSDAGQYSEELTHKQQLAFNCGSATSLGLQEQHRALFVAGAAPGGTLGHERERC